MQRVALGVGIGLLIAFAGAAAWPLASGKLPLSAEWAATANLAFALVAAVIALTAPYLSWSLTRRSQVEDSKRAVKMNVFGTIMQNRHAWESREAVSALNLIDVAFHDDHTVRELWKEYHSLITNEAFNSPIGFELRRQKLAELQTEMARVLGYSVDRFDVERRYFPTWFQNDQELGRLEREIRLAQIKSANQPQQPTPSSADDRLTNVIDLGISAVYLIRSYGDAGPEPALSIAVIGNGAIRGFDAAGAAFEGRLERQGDRVEGHATLHVSETSALVTGAAIAPGTEVPIEFILPAQFREGELQTIMVGGQPVKIALEQVRNRSERV